MATIDHIDQLERNKQLVREASFESFNEGNLDRLDEIVTDDYVLHDAGSPEDIRGRDALKEYIQTYRNAFPDLTATIDSVCAEGDLVAVRFTGHGTHEGPLPELPDLEPTGAEVEIVGIEFDRIEDGRVAETWQVYDTLGLLQQLGALPAGESPAGHETAAEENERVVTRFAEKVWSEGDLSVVDEIMAPDIVAQVPGVPEVRGREAYKDAIRSYRSGFPDFTAEITEMISAGDTVVVDYVVRGTHEGELMGIAPTGNEVSATGIVILRLKDGMIVEERNEGDLLGLFRQIGAVPEQPTA